MTNLRIIGCLAYALMILTIPALSQISPGDLAEPHAHLEGMSNCTQCHILGDKVSNEKCLKCHTEIQERIELQKGYHASEAVKSKECVTCHNDHHGRNFQIVRFSEENFNHRETGYPLSGAHGKLECKKCHKPDFITNPKVKAKKYTYLGLGTSCLSCHTDVHQNTLSSDCSDCHDFEHFKPASKFDHNRARFRLAGRHREVDCIKCHKVTLKNGKEFTEFTGVPYSNCTNCHTDAHKNQFGQDCRQCHSEESFHIIKGMDHFDHNKTNFKLENKHISVSCKSCHKTKLTDPIKHDLCSDCHTDYHKGQFAVQGISPDCSKCHSTKGFPGSSYTLEQHNSSRFPLEGAHLATPCLACHKKADTWSFRDIGMICKDCHPDIHQAYLDPKYYPEASCKVCHSATSWNAITFNHSVTKFDLSGVHAKQTCRTCHFPKGDDGLLHQRFTGLSSTCVNCHKDVHQRQFEVNGISECTKCHQFENWRVEKFDHSKTRFPLDGKHVNVACNKCHKPKQEETITYIQYKFNDFKCETCHL